MKKLDWGGFCLDLLSIVLGIFITFGIQAWIDKSHEKKEVKAALLLVKDELVNNIGNLRDAVDIIETEKAAAEYLSANAGHLSRCDADTVAAMNHILGTEYFFTVTDDALELLKSSSLFQKINDKNLSLSIIKAYDYLDTNAKEFNTHEQYKINLFLDANTDRMKKAILTNSRPAYLNSFYSTPEAGFLLLSVIEMSDESFLNDGIAEIEASIKDIESLIK